MTRTAPQQQVMYEQPQVTYAAPQQQSCTSSLCSTPPACSIRTAAAIHICCSSHTSVRTVADGIRAPATYAAPEPVESCQPQPTMVVQPQFVPQLVQYAPQERCHGGIHERCPSIPIHTTAASTVADTRACRRNNCTRIGSSCDEACDEASDQDALGLGTHEHDIDSALRSMELR